MIYLESFSFPSESQETAFLHPKDKTPEEVKNLVKKDFRTRFHYGSVYPFEILSPNGMYGASFDEITIFCGGNGCGKTTALNVIAEKLGLKRDSLFNSGRFLVQRKQQMLLPKQHRPMQLSPSRICVTGAANCRLGILKPTASTVVVSSVINCARMAVENTCIVGITTAMRACVNTRHLRTVSIAPNINAANPTAIIADGPALNTAHITSDIDYT